MKNEKCEMNKGFTFAEVIIALSLFIVLAGIGVGAYFQYYGFALVDTDVHKVSTILTQARFMALKNPTSADFGIHLDPIANTLTQFQGTYSPMAGDNQVVQLQALRLQDVLLNPNPGVTLDIVFQKQVGKTVNWGSFTVSNDKYSYTYSINPQGVIQ
jgi:type II secretory pathway pseudopilin PulG